MFQSQRGEHHAVAENAAVLGANSKSGIAIAVIEFGKVFGKVEQRLLCAFYLRRRRYSAESLNGPWRRLEQCARMNALRGVKIGKVPRASSEGGSVDPRRVGGIQTFAGDHGTVFKELAEKLHESIGAELGAIEGHDTILRQNHC
jgi:hypothetical protein